jgi:hypothetical protein
MTGHFTPTDYRLSDLMERYWTNFAKTGNPNASELPDWPRFGRDGRYIQFLKDGHVAVARDLRRAQCALYRNWILAQMHSKLSHRLYGNAQGKITSGIALVGTDGRHLRGLKKATTPKPAAAAPRIRARLRVYGAIHPPVPAARLEGIAVDAEKRRYLPP